ncbi:Acetylcholine receptor subunit alpha-like 1 [Nymphon striatum]|nr:Acetylcholine receptor subunit alpha-like 1 [Nymphon striatum]
MEVSALQFSAFATECTKPVKLIWLSLYLNADGDYAITILTKAVLHYDGRVVWKPPAIYKSSCEINVEYFPFDQQTCHMKFGSWSYDGYKVNLVHKHSSNGSNFVDLGTDLSEFYRSVEWEIMGVPAKRTEMFYVCCEHPYIDITFNITMRRKTLFYTVNLIIPCVGMSFLSVLVFYLPSHSGEKVSLSISIMLSLTVFFLLLAEIIPPTSLAVPLLGKYLLFTMVMVTLSVVLTIAVLNFNFRSPSTHRMAPWVKKLFLNELPWLLRMDRPEEENHHPSSKAPTRANMYAARDTMSIPDKNGRDHGEYGQNFPNRPSSPSQYPGRGDLNDMSPIITTTSRNYVEDSDLPPNIQNAIKNVTFIAQHMETQGKYEALEQEWQYVAMVLDRLFLFVFALACIVGSAGIILQAPSLYDDREALDTFWSKDSMRSRVPSD